MRSADLLIDAFTRIREEVEHVVGGLLAEQLAQRPDDEANSIAWLVWHLTRVQDDHVADAARIDQVWTSTNWQEKFALPFDSSATGYGFTPNDVAAVQPDSPDLLLGYHDAVFKQTTNYVDGLADADLDRIVDTRWTPAVTLGARLVSVISDDLQHVGQAAYVRGLITS
jgi:uncharacterized damage-inducible protein DinB